MTRFGEANHKLCELRHIEKTEMPGYDGKVIPERIGCEDRLEMRMYLTKCSPFTIAHELAHVSDITVRRKDSLDNLTCQMPSGWHLAYKMSSEYYANRVACKYAESDDIFRAFQHDAAGLLISARDKEWGGFLIYYSLLLGILHGIGRHDCEPLKMLRPKNIPVNVIRGMADFKRQSGGFFESHGDQGALALA
ncbi:MAG: hypothetical protein K2Q10_11335 [Rhodospirillales bacterium]|nr:hypothetical protein [Rhodospirillales bacterium]